MSRPYVVAGVNMAKVTEHRCSYCDKTFQRETSLAVHVCEQKRRWQDRNDLAVQLALQAYLRFYEITQGSSRLKVFDDFARSPYYRAFVRFARHVHAIRAVNPSRFIDWVIRNNIKIDHWCKDSVYTQYLIDYVFLEHADDAMARAIETSIVWQERTGHSAHHYLSFANPNSICHDISSGRITGWTLYNSESGQKFLDKLQQDQIQMIWDHINADAWARKFRDYPADVEYVREMLTQAGW